MSGSGKPLYEPSPWQSRFHSVVADEKLGAGAAGPGKSVCLRMEPNQQILIEHHRCTGKAEMVAPKDSWLYNLMKEHPVRWGESVGHALFLRRLQTTLKQTEMRLQIILPKIDPGVEYNVNSMMFTFSSGFKYQLGHCKDIGDWLRYYSDEYTMILYDELAEFEEIQYLQINSRLRTSDPVLRYFLKISAMSNPVQRAEGIKIKDPFWVRKRFIDDAPQGNTLLKQKYMVDGKEEFRTRIYLPARLDDNPDKQFVADYKKTLSSLPEHMRKPLLEADWYYTVNGFYSEYWIQRIHVCKPFKVPRDWKFFRSMDWGYRTPGCIGWWAMDPEDTIWCIKELNFKLKKANEVALMIRDIEEPLGLWDGRSSLITGPADTQLWEERGDVSESKAAIMARFGVTWAKAKKNRQANARMFTERLNDHHNFTTNPGIIFFENCKMCTTTIPTIAVDPENSECPLDGGYDHPHDMVLYGCAYASRGRAGIPSIKRKNRRAEEKPVGKNTYGYGYYT